MSTVIANMSVSLDGFIGSPTDGVTSLFEWYSAGPVEIPTENPDQTFYVDEQSAHVLRDAIGGVGAIVYGRATFDEAHGWGGRHPIGAPVVILTHTVPDGWPHGPGVEFVTEGGIEAAVARAKQLAGDRTVALGSPSVTQQALVAGLVDALLVDLVPVLLGVGTRWFDNLGDVPRRLGNPTVIPGNRVTHLHYPVLPASTMSTTTGA